MKEYPILFSPPMVRALLAGRKHVTRRLDLGWLKKARKGNRLWVKEGWRPQIAHSHGLGECDCGDVNVHYYADRENRFFRDELIPGDWTMPKAAAKGQVTCLFMPRWASRILLECEEDARLERLQDITEEDALIEGVEVLPPGMDIATALYCAYDDPERGWRCVSARESLITLWSTLHTKAGERWEDNPEVVRVGRFRRIQSVVEAKAGEPGE